MRELVGWLARAALARLLWGPGRLVVFLAVGLFLVAALSHGHR